MDEYEALNILDDLVSFLNGGHGDCFSYSREDWITALVTVAIPAVKREIPTEAELGGTAGYQRFCPYCKRWVCNIHTTNPDERPERCPSCGQVLEW